MVRPDEGPAAQLQPTFGYAGSLGERPPFSRFDIRDEVCESVGGFLHGQVVKDRTGREFVVVGVKNSEGEPKLWFHPKELQRPGAGVFQAEGATELRDRLTPVGTFSKAARDARAKLAAAGKQKVACRHLKESAPQDFNVLEDGEEEEVVLCAHCGLPIGDFAYTRSEEDESLVHADCMAQMVQQEFQRQSEDKQQKATALKAVQRQEYNIGWKPEMIPRNIGPARKLNCERVGRGMCCLRFQDGCDRLSLAPTVDPAGAVNLEYLSLALQVRFKEGTEPRFSLDPVEPGRKSTDIAQAMQVKRFEPAWLAGTSVGDVLFQADYHLKELSMGEHEQPVVGMKSCLDYSDSNNSDEWKAREWFIVRKAEVQVSEDNVLVPCVKMGVEAREQKVTTYGLEDSRITRKDHPLVKYAEEFTSNFDLIAERKSVIYHLRELAKASVLAKYLLEAGASLEELWFQLGEAKEASGMEVPQLWNERSRSHFQVQDGQIMDSKAFGKSTHSLYGGVQFGLDIYKIYTSHERLVQGVDLNLDSFSLDAAKQQVEKGAQVPVGKAFWTALDSSRSPVLDEEKKSLMKAVFHTSLSDRRTEGDRFVPPVLAASYVKDLHALVKREQELRRDRESSFLSARFAPGQTGELFPSSWSSAFRIENGREGNRVLRACSDFKAKPERYERVPQTTAPSFDKCTEDGTRFRIYASGSLEVRTVQEVGGCEEVKAVFSLAEPQDSSAAKLDRSEKVAKATEFVEPMASAALGCHSYVVLETESGRSILIERLQDGRTVWREDAEGLEDRNSAAKTVRSEDVLSDRLTVGDAQALQQRVGASSLHYAGEVFAAVCRSSKAPACGYRRQARGKWWLSGGTHVTKDKSRRPDKYYADKTFTVKFSDRQQFTKEQYKELKETLSFLMGVRGRQAAGVGEHESVFSLRAH